MKKLLLVAMIMLVGCAGNLKKQMIHLQSEKMTLLNSFDKAMNENNTLKKRIASVENTNHNLNQEIRNERILSGKNQRELNNEIQRLFRENEALKSLQKPDYYIVIKGDCLWNIAKKQEVYGDPFKWTRIYQVNRDSIRNPDLIYPKQVFRIPKP